MPTLTHADFDALLAAVDRGRQIEFHMAALRRLAAAAAPPLSLKNYEIRDTTGIQGINMPPGVVIRPDGG